MRKKPAVKVTKKPAKVLAVLVVRSSRNSSQSGCKIKVSLQSRFTQSPVQRSSTKILINYVLGGMVNSSKFPLVFNGDAEMKTTLESEFH